MSSTHTLADWLRKEPFALALSSSFFGFYAHAGALRALHDAGLRPARVCGSSAGSVVAALYGGGLDPATSLPALIFRLRHADILTPFWFAPWSCLQKGGLAVINQRFLRDNSPVPLLEHTKLPVSISTWCTEREQTVVHTTGDVANVVAASCAIPKLFQPVEVDGRVHVDGGLGDLLALASIGKTERALSIDLHTSGLTGPRANLLSRFDAQRRSAGIQLEGTVRLQLHEVPFVGPTTMKSVGPFAYESGRRAMNEALGLRRPEWGNERIVVVRADGAATGAGMVDVAAGGASLS